MKLLVLYRPKSEFATSVEEFVRELQKVHNIDARRMEVLDYDTQDGWSMASIYDVMQQPAIILVKDDGSYVKHWEGDALPLMDEVAGYMYGSDSVGLL